MDMERLYRCEDCGLHYEGKQLAEECYEFCTKNHACSLEIAQNSVEYKRLIKEREDNPPKQRD